VGKGEGYGLEPKKTLASQGKEGRKGVKKRTHKKVNTMHDGTMGHSPWGAADFGKTGLQKSCRWRRGNKKVLNAKREKAFQIEEGRVQRKSSAWVKEQSIKKRKFRDEKLKR